MAKGEKRGKTPLGDSGSTRRPGARPKRPRKRRAAALGNDPFESGAAHRASPQPLAEIEGPPETPSFRGDPVAPQPTTDLVKGVERRVGEALGAAEKRLQELAERAGAPGVGGDIRLAVERVLPRLNDALGAFVALARLLQPPARLDRYGMDPDFAERADPLLEFLYSTWWRTEVRNAERVPASGPVMIVANHGGAVPWDALVLRRALLRDHPAHRDLRPLIDDAECDIPGFGSLAIRLGAIRSAPEPVDRILHAEGMVGVFPEGSAVLKRPWRDRYRIQHFGRGGFAKLALRTGAPIVPCAILGSEEASPAIARPGWLAEKLGLPNFSVNPAIRIGPAGLVPLPSRWSLTFGEPLDTRSLGKAAADNPSSVMAITEEVRGRLQSMLDEAVAGRGGVFL